MKYKINNVYGVYWEFANKKPLNILFCKSYVEQRTKIDRMFIFQFARLKTGTDIAVGRK